MSLPTTIDLDDLGFDRGAHLLIAHALTPREPGSRLHVVGRDPALAVHLRAWARRVGHGYENPNTIVKGSAAEDRLVGAVRGGSASAAVSRPDPTWGLAARGALIEAGGPPVHFELDRAELVWADIAPRLYAQAVANQWDPATAIDWDAGDALPAEIEAAVVQVMTYLIENEQAALVVPARFVGRIHPQFREVMQFLAVQVADEARHIEVFTRRARLRGNELGVSGAGGRASLATLLDEPDFTLASFLLSVLGEGTFLDLLGFLERHAPDPVTQQVARLALQDEARHVAFGVAHVAHHVAADPARLSRLRVAIERRHTALAATAGLNENVFDALIVLAAGEWSSAAIARGYERVQELQQAMDSGRRGRLARIGFSPAAAAELSSLHTRNFM